MEFLRVVEEELRALAAEARRRHPVVQEAAERYAHTGTWNLVNTYQVDYSYSSSTSGTWYIPVYSYPYGQLHKHANTTNSYHCVRGI